MCIRDRKHAVGADDAETLCLRFFEALLQVGHVGIGVAVTYGFAETHAVDDRGVVQGDVYKRQIQFFADLGEGCDATIQLVGGMACRYLYACLLYTSRCV